MIVPLPTLQNIFVSSTEPAQSMFDFGFPYLAIGTGLFIATLIIMWLWGMFIGLFEKMSDSFSDFNILKGLSSFRGSKGIDEDIAFFQSKNEAFKGFMAKGGVADLTPNQRIMLWQRYGTALTNRRHEYNSDDLVMNKKEIELNNMLAENTRTANELALKYRRPSELSARLDLDDFEIK